MNFKKFLVILLIFGIIFLFLLKNFLFKHLEIHYQTKASVLPFLEKVGVSVDIDKIDFGIAAKGMQIRKVLNVTNSETLLAKVKVKVIGNISKFVKIEPNNFLLSPNNTQAITLEFFGKEIGNYTGEIAVRIEVPKYKFMEDFLRWI